MQRFQNEDIYYPKKECGKRCYGELLMIVFMQGTNALLSSLKKNPLNGFRLEPTTLLKYVVSLATNLLTLFGTTIKFIPLEKSNMKLIKHNIYAKERNI